MYKVALIGAGTMGGVHAQSYVGLAGVELVAIHDSRPEVARALAERVGVPTSVVRETIGEILDDASVDALSICVPTPSHKEYTLAAARAGKHVFCEKPIARTVADAEEMVTACQDAGVRLMIGHVLRFFPEYVAARQALKSGNIGEPGVVRASRTSGQPRGWDGWYTKPELSGGVILDMMIHDIDWLCWCLGRPVRVYAKGLGDKGLPRFDYSLVTIRFESGAIAHLEGSWAHPGGFNTKLEIAGTGGLIDFQSPLAAPLKLELSGAGRASGAAVVLESPLLRSPYFVEDEHFFECIGSGAAFLTTPAEAVTAAAVALAACESIHTGLAVEMGGELHD